MNDRAAMPSEAIMVHFDGACEPVNPGGVATCGWLIRDSQGALLAKGAREVRRGPMATNNLAEWCALGLALAWIKDNAIGVSRDLILKGDSQLVVYQLCGKWKCNKPHLRKLKARCLELLQQTGCRSWKSIWVPREENEEADLLSRQAYEQATGRKFPERARRA